jgi:ribosomal peptide maturation radical SAM protein 1
MGAMRFVDARPLLRDADVLLVVPPFAWQDRPALGVHLLQAAARRAGFEAQVLYANLLFAASFGERTHMSLARLQHGLFLGERLFARAAFGTPALGRDAGADLAAALDAVRAACALKGLRFELTVEQLRALESRVPEWLDSFVPAVAERRYRVVGCTSSFEQNGASLAILDGVKARSAGTVTILGGANCEAEMAEGVLSLGGRVDHLFSGESERSFVEFLEGLRSGAPAAPRIIQGEPCRDLDALATPDFADFHAQERALTPDGAFSGAHGYLAYETSRGCWWGQKSHCTFCGLNGQGMVSREKSPDRALDELRALVAASPTRKVLMTDNIMPHSYFRTLLPRLQAELPGVEIMYEQKANLTLKQVLLLVESGVREIQPGIEALSTGLLALMAKGTTAAQNLALLRYARAAGLRLQWNLLCGFPGDERAFYVETAELVPLIPHLPPPNRLNPVIFDRFSPYHGRPAQFGIRGLKALPHYRAVFPESADVERLAYHFEGEFASGGLDDKELLRRLSGAVAAWRARWLSPARPALTVERRGGRLWLTDTRGLDGLPAEQPLDAAQAMTALVPRRVSERARAEYAWAIAHRLVVERDRRFVPLAVAAPELLLELEARAPALDLRSTFTVGDVDMTTTP